MGWVGAILGGVGAVNDISDNVKSQAATQAEIADNQKLAYVAADDALARGGKEAAKIRGNGTQLASAQSVAYANSGVDGTVGTAANVQADSRAMSELDALTVQNNAAREAWGFKRYGLKYGQQAQLEAARASNKQAATILGGVGKVAAGAGSTYESWNK